MGSIAIVEIISDIFLEFNKLLVNWFNITSSYKMIHLIINDTLDSLMNFLHLSAICDNTIIVKAMDSI